MSVPLGFLCLEVLFKLLPPFSDLVGFGEFPIIFLVIHEHFQFEGPPIRTESYTSGDLEGLRLSCRDFSLYKSIILGNQANFADAEVKLV